MAQLNNFKKIILATGQINYLASVIETVNLELTGFLRGPDQSTCEFVEDLTTEKEALFSKIATILSTALGGLVQFTEDHSMVATIDQRISSVPLEILILGMDDEEDTYEHSEENTNERD